MSIYRKNLSWTSEVGYKVFEKFPSATLTRTKLYLVNIELRKILRLDKFWLVFCGPLLKIFATQPTWRCRSFGFKVSISVSFLETAGAAQCELVLVAKLIVVAWKETIFTIYTRTVYEESRGCRGVNGSRAF